MKTTHKQKVALARKLNTLVDSKGKSHTLNHGLFIYQQDQGQVAYNPRWENHRNTVARAVAKREERIKLAIQKKREAQNVQA